jgi:hypothetical protein
MGRHANCTAAAIVAFGAASLTGCGGDSTEPAFSVQAEAVCADANRAVRALGPEPRLLTLVHARWVERVMKISLDAVEELRTLRPPEQARKNVDAMLAAFQAAYASGDEIARLSRRGDEQGFRAAVASSVEQLRKAQLAAAELNLDSCLRLGVPSRP